MKIAVVDQDLLTRDFIVNVMMYSVNREVFAFEDAEGLKRYLAEKGAPHLVFSEMRLPGSSGIELLQFIKKEFPGTRFIALSADPADETAAAEMGADAFLAKPFLLKDLFEIVQRFIVEDVSSS